MRFLAFIVCLCLALPAWAVQIQVTVPDDAVPRAQVLCEELRVQTRWPTAEWSNGICLSIIVYRGLRNFEADVSREDARDSVRDAVRDALVAFDENYPDSVTKGSFCGDGDVDGEFGEGCDDGNRDNGDGCSYECLVE